MPHRLQTVCNAAALWAVSQAKHESCSRVGLSTGIRSTPKSVPYPPIEPEPIAARFPEPKPGEDVVAVSRSMSPALVLEAYRQGIFPWPVRQGLVPWASPDPRAVFPLQASPWPRTVKRAFKRSFRVSVDEAFDAVMRACGEREGGGTWITPDIISTYSVLHRLGWAHSVEVWQGELLAGGLYGIAM